jgi:S-adenosylmethionine/arginine decarboxylase-like enzyme
MAQMQHAPKVSEQANAVPYGYELVMDLHECNASSFTRDSIDRYFSDLCDLIDMERCVVHFWDDVGVSEEEKQTLPHTKGTSAVCFILTSSIVIHTLDLLGAVYVNIFSCKSFDVDDAREFTKNWFGATHVRETSLARI